MSPLQTEKSKTIQRCKRCGKWHTEPEGQCPGTFKITHVDPDELKKIYKKG